MVETVKKKKRSITNMLRKERKWNHINAQLKQQKVKIKSRRQNRNKEQGHQIEKSNEYDRYISRHFEC